MNSFSFGPMMLVMLAFFAAPFLVMWWLHGHERRGGTWVTTGEITARCFVVGGLFLMVGSPGVLAPFNSATWAVIFRMTFVVGSFMCAIGFIMFFLHIDLLRPKEQREFVGWTKYKFLMLIGLYMFLGFGLLPCIKAESLLTDLSIEFQMEQLEAKGYSFDRNNCSQVYCKEYPDTPVYLGWKQIAADVKPGDKLMVKIGKDPKTGKLILVGDYLLMPPVNTTAKNS